MFTLRDHFSNASQANLETQIEFGTAVVGVLLNGSRQLLDLQIGIVKAGLQEAEELSGELIATDTPIEFASVAAAQIAPTVSKILASQCHAARIMVGTQAGMLEVLDARAIATKREAIALIADVSKNAPPAAGRTVVFLRSLYEHANARYERLTHSTRKFLGTLETGFNKLGNQLASAAHEGHSYQGVHL